MIPSLRLKSLVDVSLGSSGESLFDFLALCKIDWQVVVY